MIPEREGGAITIERNISDNRRQRNGVQPLLW